MTVQVVRITIFPVKSCDGVEVTSATIGPAGGLAGDREFAMVDAQGQWVNGKRVPALLRIRSSFRGREWTLDGAVFHLDRDRAALETRLAALLEIPVRLEQDVVAGFPDDTDAAGPTLISTATLQEVGRWFGAGPDEVRRRFRANLEIDGVPPFWEDRFFGPHGLTVPFQIGDVRLDGNNPCARCAVPSRNPWTGEVSDPAFAARFADLRQQHLPAWADRSRFDHYYRLAVNTKVPVTETGKTLRVGDKVSDSRP